jgi:lupus La protein
MSDEQSQQSILQQVEFYFSESNLLNDRFLFTTQNANDGWVPIQTISQFERMKKYRPVETIVEALRKSPELLEVSENGEMVRRKIPLPKNYNEIQLNINKRSIFVEKLPQDATLDQLLTYFRAIAPVNQVRMKKNRERKFVGSCIVEFKNAEDAEKILSGVADSKLKYGEGESAVELDVISKTAYDESKAQKFGERRGGKFNKNKKRGRESKDATKEESKEESKEETKQRDASPVRKSEEVKERD